MRITTSYLGIDLGTTNSAAAVFDGEKTQMVRTAQGGLLTPSVVRIDGRGNITVGDRARRLLETDPTNTRAEFKRLMGTGSSIEFAASGRSHTPVELSAEVLRSLCRDVADQFGLTPSQAVISVPALFELPQASATSEAARLAGLERVELIQEPIASALAAGWTKGDDEGYWLVYDLGGGTFDASLLETRDGFLRVVGHDGDNFLGGRDFDAAIVDWALAAFNTEHGQCLERSNPSHASAIRVLKMAAEEAKIALSRSESAVISVPDLVNGLPLDLDLDRTAFRGLTQALVDRSISVCRRLLEQHRVPVKGLHRIVLVGGPTLIPFLRERVSHVLNAPFSENLDPMTLVAQGAALFAGTVGLAMAPRPDESEQGAPVWLQYPPVSTDLSPHLVGRLVGDAAVDKVVAVHVRRADGAWRSPEIALGEQRSFVVTLELIARASSEFRLEGLTAEGSPVALSPSSFSIVQGLTISDPPLSRSIGVALSDDTVRVFLHRGAPLPARATITLHTVETVVKGAGDLSLGIPIVQGEASRAELCRLVGTVKISGTEVNASIPAGTAVDVTIEVDRSGRLSSQALVTSVGQMFSHVVHLSIPDARPETLQAANDRVVQRIWELKASGSDAGLSITDALELELALGRVARDIDAARGGDDDAGQKARRLLQDVELRLEAFDTRKQLQAVMRELQAALVFASGQASRDGTEVERRLFNEIEANARKAKEQGDIGEMQRCTVQLDRLGAGIRMRDDSLWYAQLKYYQRAVFMARDPLRAKALLEEGDAAASRGDAATVRRICGALGPLFPQSDSAGRGRDGGNTHDSGVR